MGKGKSVKSTTGQVMCCSHCADSKYPCVNMERSMRGEKSETEPELKEQEEK